MRPSLFSFVVAVLVLAGCASGSSGRVPGSPDGAIRRDAGGDLGDPDLGGLDGGAPDLALPDLGDADLGNTDLGAADLGSDDLGASDLGRTDLGAPDLGRDLGPPGCTSAASCQDGLACNGVEACIGGACRPGTSVVCDDGIACTTNSCLEPSGACEFVRNDAACPAGQTCTAPTASGCAASGACSESPCRLVAPQCGCPTGQGCTLSGSTRVCAAAGTGATGATCGTAGLGCTAGNACIGLGVGTTAAACERFCATDADCSGAGALCILRLNDAGGMPIPGVTLCTLSCNPVSGASCPSGSACRVFVESMGAGRYLTHCEGPVGTGTQGFPCIDDGDCTSGYACLNAGFGNECTRWCNLATGAGCPFGTLCQDPFADPVTIGGTSYGVCI